jgi:hypothetical protein
MRRTYSEEGLIGGALGASAALCLVLGLLGLGGGLDAVFAAFGRPPSPAWASWWAAAGIGARLGALAGPLSALVAAIFGALAVAWALARQADEWHVRGPWFEPDPERFAQALGSYESAAFSQQQKAHAVSGLQIGGVELSRTRETAHMLVVGLPGAGKTTLLYSMVRQALDRGDRLLVHDPKGDLLAGFSSGLATDAVAVLGPWDARSRPWDIARDVASPAAADQFARACFPRDDGGANQFFTSAAREVLSGLVRYLQASGTWTWRDLAALLDSGADALLAAAHAGNPLCKTQVPDAVNPGSRAVLAELATGAAWIPGYAAAFAHEVQPFSMKDWALGNSPERFVVLNSDARYSSRAEQIFGGMLSALADAVASPAMPERSPEDHGVWIIADEMPQLSQSAQAALLRVEEMGRSRGVRVVKAMQDPSQLRAREGADKAEAARSMQQTRIYLRLSTSAAAAVCKDLGDREIERLDFPLTTGQGNKRILREKVPVLRVDALMGLQVRRDGPASGVEMIVSIDDKLGKMIQPFPAKSASAPAVIPNPRWDAPAATPSSDSRAADPLQPQGTHDRQTRLSVPNEIDEDDLPIPIGESVPTDVDPPPSDPDTPRPSPDWRKLEW